MSAVALVCMYFFIMWILRRIVLPYSWFIVISCSSWTLPFLATYDYQLLNTKIETIVVYLRRRCIPYYIPYNPNLFVFQYYNNHILTYSFSLLAMFVKQKIYKYLFVFFKIKFVITAFAAIFIVVHCHVSCGANV